MKNIKINLMENNSNINNIDYENANKSLLIKALYGIIGGIQSILHIISGFCDMFYLLKEFKVYILENIFKAIKYSIKFLKFILSFKFIDNKAIRLISNIIILFGISLCLILLILIKNEKQNSLINKDCEEKTHLKSFLNSIDKNQNL